MKIRVITERQAQSGWPRFIDLQQRGYVFVIKRGGKAVARLEAIASTISRAKADGTY